MSDLAQIYRRAAEILDERGWHQGWYADRDGQRVCLLGACAVAVGGTFEVDPDTHEPPLRFAEENRRRLWFAAWDGLLAVRHYVSGWNDEPGRTADEVKAFLLEAAEKAEARRG